MPWCEDCNQHFSTSSRLQRHLDTSAAHQTPEYVCEPCNRVFNTEEGLTKHEKNSVKHLHNKYNYVCEDCHWGCNKEKTMDEHDTEFHFWCKEHDRFFADENELRQHRISRAHMTQSQPCPCCNNTFPTLYAVVLHFESGRCDSGINRLQFERHIDCHDPDGRFTNRKIFDGDWEEPDVWIYESKDAWNGDGFECDSCDKEYPSLSKLNGHITRWHTDRVDDLGLYRCPGCYKKWNLFSALVGHIEHSQNCEVSGDWKVASRLKRLVMSVQV